MPGSARVSSDPRGVIDAEAFNQILELDDDDTHAYSKDIVAAYFAQAPDAFASMDAALTAMDLTTLADVAHFLMGSSATLGIARVAGACGRLERMEGAGGKDGDALAKMLAEVKREYADAARWLRRWYEDHGQPFAEQTPKPPLKNSAVPADSASKLDAAGSVDGPPPTLGPSSAGAPPGSETKLEPPSSCVAESAVVPPPGSGPALDAKLDSESPSTKAP